MALKQEKGTGLILKTGETFFPFDIRILSVGEHRLLCSGNLVRIPVQGCHLFRPKLPPPGGIFPHLIPIKLATTPSQV